MVHNDSSSTRRTETHTAYQNMMGSMSDSVADVVSRKLTSWTDVAHQRHEKSSHALLKPMESFLQGIACQSFISLVIMAQGVMIGISANTNAKLAYQKWDGESLQAIEATEQLIDAFFYVDVGFSLVFTVDLLIRFVCERWLFLLGKEWKWNVLDLMLVTSAAVEFLLVVSISFVDVSFFRLLRISRAFRTLRIFRMFRMFTGLRVMVDAIFHSMLPLLWTSIFLTILIFIFAVLFLQAVTNFLEGSSDGLLVDHLRIFFENIPLTMLTLFMSITGGVSWWEVIELLLEVETPWFGLLFVAYIAVMFIFVLNIITGVLVNNVVESARHEKEMQKEQRTKFLKEVRELWNLMDLDGAGFLSRPQFREALRQANVQEFFDRLNYDLSDASSFFDSLDDDGDGKVELEEFVVGMVRSCFKSNMVDSQTLLREHRKAKREAARLARETEAHLSHIDRHLGWVARDQKHLFRLVDRAFGGVGSFSQLCSSSEVDHLSQATDSRKRSTVRFSSQERAVTPVPDILATSSSSGDISTLTT